MPSKEPAAAKLWRIANKQRLAVYQHDYYLANRERSLERSRDYYRTNKAAVDAGTRRWRQANKEKDAATHRRYRLLHKVKRRDASRTREELRRRNVASAYVVQRLNRMGFAFTTDSVLPQILEAYREGLLNKRLLKQIKNSGALGATRPA